MATYEYRLGFRFVVNPCSSVDPGRERPTETSTKKSSTMGNHGTFTEARRHSPQSTRDSAATKIQRVVRGWRARVWSVIVVYDRAWRALMLLQATWRGALVRRKLWHHNSEISAAGESYQQKQRTQNISSRRSEASTTTNGRHPDRVAWEQSWVRIRLGCPSFRDRVRMWQTIIEIKRSAGGCEEGGSTKITNNEAWAALSESSGVVSVAVTRLSSQDYILGKRLQDRKNKPCEIPLFLSLSRTALHGTNNIRPSPTTPAEVMKDHMLLLQQSTAAGKRTQMRDVFESISDIFYECNASDSIKKTGYSTMGADKKHNLK